MRARGQKSCNWWFENERQLEKFLLWRPSKVPYDKRDRRSDSGWREPHQTKWHVLRHALAHTQHHCFRSRLLLDLQRTLLLHWWQTDMFQLEACHWLQEVPPKFPLRQVCLDNEKPSSHSKNNMKHLSLPNQTKYRLAHYKELSTMIYRIY